MRNTLWRLSPLFHFQHFAMLLRIILLGKHVGEFAKGICSANFVDQLGNHHNMEVLEEVEDLINILVLHLSARYALSACALFIREYNLPNHTPILKSIPG